MKNIAALLTCHNRHSKTLDCLDALLKNILPSEYSLDVFLLDDGSTDSTAQAVSENYPKVNIIKGDGNLYWNGGMRVAFAAAMELGFDYYLWLNDDTTLYPTVLVTMIHTACDLQAKQGKSVIVVGSTQDENTKKTTYGGVLRPNKWKATTFVLVEPRKTPVECETMNGNCVLIPHEIAQTVGNLEPKFAHTMGDTDYGLRARQAGFAVWLMPGFAGGCSRNEVSGSFKDSTLSLKVRLQKIMQPKGLPPCSWFIFTRRHTGFFWLFFWLWPYAKLVVKGFFNKVF